MAEASSNGNNVEAIDRIYATALLDLAIQHNQADELLGEIEELIELFQREQGLQALLSNRMLSNSDRTAAVKRIFDGNVGDLLYRFIRVVSDKQRLDHLLPIFKAYRKLYDEHRGIFDVDIYVASPLDQTSLDGVAQRIGQSIGGTARLQQHLDPKLIGGLKVRIGDRLVDGSVATQLRIIRENIVRQGREKVRQQADTLVEA